jgi:ABC-2 type transport system ATP-binding protein
MNETETAIEVVDLRKTYKGGSTCALDGITFSVAKGEIFGLIGPNGAGKTTLIGCLLALLKPDSGTIKILGKPADYISVRQSTGYVPERSDFEHWMTGRQFLQYHHGLAGLDSSTRNKDIDDCLEMVELAKSAWNRRLRTYSRGMLQRLNLAQLLIGKPQLAFLDEPTLGLDPTGVTVVRNIIANMRENGVTAIINSHQLDEVERLCDRVAFIRQGKIASIETIKGGNITDYMMFVRWSENMLNGSLESVVQEAASSSQTDLTECHHDWGRFRVKDHLAATGLIRELVARGVPVEEAVPERMRLEQLFAGETGGEANNE